MHGVHGAGAHKLASWPRRAATRSTAEGGTHTPARALQVIREQQNKEYNERKALKQARPLTIAHWPGHRGG